MNYWNYSVFDGRWKFIDLIVSHWIQKRMSSKNSVIIQICYKPTSKYKHSSSSSYPSSPEQRHCSVPRIRLLRHDNMWPVGWVWPHWQTILAFTSKFQMLKIKSDKRKNKANTFKNLGMTKTLVSSDN